MAQNDFPPENEPVVVITGATAGIGRVTTRLFAAHKAKIGLIARDQHRLDETGKEVASLGGQAITLKADVADPHHMESAARQVEKAFGPVDIWVNNAMATIFSPLKDITPEEYKRATEVTYLGSVYGTMAALKHMRPRNQGAIVQVGSALAYRGIPLQAPYCGAKFALRGFLDSLRAELLHEQLNIHLTMVQLPAHNTPQFSWARSNMDKHPQPVPPIYAPEIAAQAIYFAAYHRRREVWVGQPTIATILGNKIFPGLLDRYLAIKGFQTQLANKPPEKNQPGNLFKPVKGEYAAEGAFTKRSQGTAPQFTFEKIPFLYLFARPVFALIALVGMIPGFLKKLFNHDRAQEIVWR